MNKGIRSVRFTFTSGYNTKKPFRYNFEPGLHI